LTHSLAVHADVHQSSLDGRANLEHDEVVAGAVDMTLSVNSRTNSPPWPSRDERVGLLGLAVEVRFAESAFGSVAFAGFGLPAV
jgi:hypothetical protein